MDTSLSSSYHNGIVGIVIRGAMGQFVTAARFAVQAPNVLTAKVLAMLKGCQLATNFGYRQVIFESDSKETILSLSRSLNAGRWEAVPTLTFVKRMEASFQDCRWSWSPRTANMASHSLVSRDNTEMCNVTWVNRPPSSLVHVLNKDGLPYPLDPINFVCSWRGDAIIWF